MGYEIDYLPVGEGERSATAIALRYGNLFGRRDEQVVITIDGGTLESGAALVNHVRTHFGTEVVDIAMLTHPDTDHASGMREVLEKLDVKQLAMHLPWAHSADINDLLDDGRCTTTSIREKTRRNLKAAREIETVARRKGIAIVEPFAGVRSQNGVLTVLGPTVDFYRQMLANFRFMPGAATDESVARLLRLLIEKAAKFLPESWLSETLKEPAEDATSPENNSSAVFMLQIDGKKLLFTGDAGVPALKAAIAYADASGISLDGISFFDVPHHGSRKNLSPTVVNRLFGGIRASDSPTWTAFVSAAKDGAPKHPHKKVTNALRRRGASVHVTAGTHIRHSHQAPDRERWTNHEPEPFHHQVEDDD